MEIGSRYSLLFAGLIWYSGVAVLAADATSETVELNRRRVQPPAADLLGEYCFDCHRGQDAKGGIDLDSVPWQLDDPHVRQTWVKVFDQLQSQVMPPEADSLSAATREAWLAELGHSLDKADERDLISRGRSSLRRLNRDEFQYNLRDLLSLPELDVRDLLPADRERYHFTKSSVALDMTRVQLDAFLDAAGVALRQAVATGSQPRKQVVYHALATNMFPKAIDHAGRESTFYAKNSRMIPLSKPELDRIRKENSHDAEVEVAIFRSASWPYYGYPEEFEAGQPGRYRVRFSARAVRQLPDFRLQPAWTTHPMTFRARKRSLADVSGDVRAVGGWIDIQPEESVYETTVLLKEKETIEYSLLGLPVPYPITSHGGPLYYDFPPPPPGGHRGIAFRWIEIIGPIDAEDSSEWPPASHRVLFDDLPIRDVDDRPLSIEVVSTEPRRDAKRLLKRFSQLATRRIVDEQSLAPYRRLIFDQLDAGSSFTEAMLVGYQAFLCSSHFLYLHDPGSTKDNDDLAARLSHFLGSTRPDAELMRLAKQHRLRDPQVLSAQANRLIESPSFDRFVADFADGWLDLQHVKRDDPDIRLYPEYRFDDYLIESAERETKSFLSTVIRENHAVTTLVDSDFLMINDTLAKHYDLRDVSGSAMRKVMLPDVSPYGGLMTQAAIMKVTANGTTTSPVVRGAWIMDRLLGEPPPPPPEKVPAIEPDIRGATTIRQLLARHTKADECRGCHARFDPVGFALENLDVMGGWRDRYRSLEKGDEITGIDRAGHRYAYRVASAVEADGQLSDGRSFTDVRELKALLASEPRKLAANLLRQWTIYATGEPPRFSDRDALTAILDECEPTNYRVRDLLDQFIQSRMFMGNVLSPGTLPASTQDN